MLQQGYSTFATGKRHLTPAEAGSPAGPYERWPLGRGFERYYGFLGGDTHQYYPELVYDNHQVEAPKGPEEGYHFTEDMTDKAISFVADSKQIAPDKPFFLYYAPGAMHAPHHVPAEWADRYQGEFDDGWSAYREKTLARMKELGIVPEDTDLSRHDPDVPEWDTLSDDERRLYAPARADRASSPTKMCRRAISSSATRSRSLVNPISRPAREVPGRECGYRHVLRVSDVQKSLDLSGQSKPHRGQK